MLKLRQRHGKISGMNVRRQTVKKYRKEIIILALFVLACLSLFLLGEGMFTLLEDETADKLLRETLARFLAFAFIAVKMFSQDPIRFLGIPVDGTEKDMIAALKSKGFEYDSTKECL